MGPDTLLCLAFMEVRFRVCVWRAPAGLPLGIPLGGGGGGGDKAGQCNCRACAPSARPVCLAVCRLGCVRDTACADCILRCACVPVALEILTTPPPPYLRAWKIGFRLPKYIFHRRCGSRTSLQAQGLYTDYIRIAGVVWMAYTLSDTVCAVLFAG